MTTSLTDLAMNPFDDDIVREPREVTFSVPGLNNNQLKQLVGSLSLEKKLLLDRLSAIERD